MPSLPGSPLPKRLLRRLAVLSPAASDAGLALAQGKKLQDAAFAAAGRVLPPSPFAADALSFARSVASGKNIQHAALSIAGQRVLQGQKVYQKPRNMKRELHFG